MPNTVIASPTSTTPVDRLSLISSDPRGADPATASYVERCFADD